VQTDQVNFCACAYAHMHKTDLLIIPTKRHARYFIYVISSTPMRRNSSAELFYCCTSPQIPLRTAQKNRSHVHNSAASNSLTLLISGPRQSHRSTRPIPHLRSSVFIARERSDRVLIDFSSVASQSTSLRVQRKRKGENCERLLGVQNG
jgi:hypothetical protein